MLKSNIQHEHMLPEGNYKVTEALLKDMILSKKSVERPLRPREVRNFIKLNLLNIIKRKRISGIPSSDIIEGFIYVISHPRQPGYYKIGRTLDPHNRITQYQSYCPERAYVRECYIPVYDAREVEKSIHAELAEYRVNGEWFYVGLGHIKSILYPMKIYFIIKDTELR